MTKKFEETGCAFVRIVAGLARCGRCGWEVRTSQTDVRRLHRRCPARLAKLAINENATAMKENRSAADVRLCACAGPWLRSELCATCRGRVRIHVYRCARPEVAETTIASCRKCPHFERKKP